MEVRFRANVADAGWFQQVVPCQYACPAHTDVPRYIKLIAEGRFDESYLVNQRYNVFPEILGRVCARPCESACRRGRIDRAVAICHLKRSAGDHKKMLDILTCNLPPIRENSKRVAVVGAGPSGLAAAQDLRKQGYQVVVFDALPKAGGMLVGGIPAWRLPRDVVRREIDDYFAALGVTIHLRTRVGKDVFLRELLREYDAVYLAAGTQAPQRLGISGEDLELVYPGLAFMEKVNLACAQGPRRSDGSEDSTPPHASGSTKKADLCLRLPRVGRRVAVIGGGFTAMDCSRSALRMGAEKVYVLYRRTKAEMPIDEYEREAAEAEHVEFQYLISPAAVLDDGHGRVGGLMCTRNRLGEPDSSGRRAPVTINGSDFRLDVDTVIVATGQVADLSWVEPELGLRGNNGRPAIDREMWMAAAPGLFAGGDFVAGARNVISAIADGHAAAADIERYLLGSQQKRRVLSLSHLVPYVVTRDYPEIKRVEMPALRPGQRCDWTKGPAWNLSNEVEKGYTEELARQEAQRCLLCYRQVTINPDACVLCSRCVEYCPYDCIKLVPLESLADGGGVDELAKAHLGNALDSYKQDDKEPSNPYEEAKAFVFDEDYCIRCGICEAVCPSGALTMKLFELKEVEA